MDGSPSTRRLHFNTWCKQNLWNSPIWQIWNEDESIVKFITKTLWFELFSIEYTDDGNYNFSTMKESFFQQELETFARENPAGSSCSRLPLVLVEENTNFVWSISEGGLQSPSQSFNTRTNYNKIIEFFMAHFDVGYSKTPQTNYGKVIGFLKTWVDPAPETKAKPVYKATLQAIENGKYKIEISHIPTSDGIWMIKSQHTLSPQISPHM
jgi:hypothetical protein